MRRPSWLRVGIALGAIDICHSIWRGLALDIDGCGSVLVLVILLTVLLSGTTWVLRLLLGSRHFPLFGGA